MKIPWKEIEELTKYLKEKGLSEISIETTDGKITVKKDLQGKIIPTVETHSHASLQKGLYEVKSPMVGTFYISPSPGAEPFVQIGSKIKSGRVLCIIEAMKIMNELPSEVNGTVKEILVKDNQTVEYGQVLMRIEQG
ncbi:MAG: acetyl-CoA carboxylase biotin carboxyl carrier protein [Candidatus Melainabacteria bacterium]|nr:acetyl-CoA carboxylase biotin carboxyl carrier protein [Candidatus Melainabacteria bacterium]